MPHAGAGIYQVLAFFLVNPAPAAAAADWRPKVQSEILAQSFQGRTAMAGVHVVRLDTEGGTQLQRVILVR